MWESFIEEVERQIKEMVDTEGEAIKKAAAVIAAAIEMDGIIIPSAAATRRLSPRRSSAGGRDRPG